jgi:hypothetical protein
MSFFFSFLMTCDTATSNNSLLHKPGHMSVYTLFILDGTYKLMTWDLFCTGLTLLTLFINSFLDFTVIGLFPILRNKKTELNAPFSDKSTRRIRSKKLVNKKITTKTCINSYYN